MGSDLTPPSLATLVAPDREIELKLAAEPASLAALWAAPALADHGRPGPTRRLETCYFDTADGRLQRRGLSLRVRRVGRRYQQALKAGGNGRGLHLDRGEWEVPIDGAEPELDRLPPPARELLGLVLPGELKPIFTTRVRRQIRHLDAVEIACDIGEIEAGARREPIAELELELRAGAPAALYELAVALHQQAPSLRLETRSKSARGYHLAGLASAATARKATRLELPGDATVGEALVLIVRHGLEHVVAHAAVAAAGADPEGVHQMRVGLRRLRSALALFRDEIPAERLGWLKAETKWLAGALGPTRDWDVFLAETLRVLLRRRPQDAGLGRLIAAAETARAAGYEQVRAALADPRYSALALRLGLWVETGFDDDAGGSPRRRLPMRERAGRLLKRRHKRALAAGQDFAALSPDARHALRIALKQLRYAIEFFRSLWDDDIVAPYHEALAGLQDVLGHMNDMAVAERLVGALAAADSHAGGLVVGWHLRGREALLDHAGADWRRFAETEPFWR